VPEIPVPEDLEQIGALLDAAVSGGGIPGAVAVAGQGPATLGQWTVGQADALQARPMRADTVFDLASLTKVMATTTVTLALAGRGELGLGDQVAGYLPGFAACRDAGVTVAHLLTHTSGLPGSRQFYRWCRSRDGLLRELCLTPLEAPPGTRVRYSDPGFITLGEVAAAAAGEPLDQAVRRLVTGPLGLASVTFVPNGSARHFAATETRGDGTAWTGVVHDENARLMGGVAGHAGLFATAQDLARFAAWWVSDDDTAVPARLRRDATACQTEDAGGRRGYGWTCVGDAFDILGGHWPPTAVSHTGFTGTSLALDPAGGRWLVLLTNAVHAGRDATAVQALRRAVHAVPWDELLPERPDLDLAERRDRMRRGHQDRLVEGSALQHVVAADDLLGLGERPVADQHLAVPDGDRPGRARRREPVPVQPDAPRDHVVEPRKASVAAVVLVRLGPAVLGTDQHQELHVVSDPRSRCLHHHDERESSKGQPCASAGPARRGRVPRTRRTASWPPAPRPARRRPAACPPGSRCAAGRARTRTSPPPSARPGRRRSAGRGCPGRQAPGRRTRG